MDRKPSAPRSASVVPAACRTRRRAAYSAGSPWVCGHHSRTSGTLKRPEYRSPAPDGVRTAVWVRPSRSTTSSTLFVVAPSRAAMRHAAVRLPSASARRRRSSMATPRRRSRRTPRHGPTGAAGGDQPGVRPSSVVRNQRSCWCISIGTRHRGRGRRALRSRSRERQQMTSSFSARTDSSTRTSCDVNMLSLVRRRAPLSHTSATVARPSKHSHSCSPRPAGCAANRVRYHQSSASKSRTGPSRSHVPARRNDAAAVEGTVVGVQASACSALSGSVTPPAVPAASSQAAVSHWASCPEMMTRPLTTGDRSSGAPRSPRRSPRCSRTRRAAACGRGTPRRTRLPARASR